MTSKQLKPLTKSCYVYITLPGETNAVTAARCELTRDAVGNALGRFVYGKSYLDRNNAVALDPLELKLGRKTHETTLNKGLFGAIKDASPDYWGRLIIERAMSGIQLDEMDYLLQSADDRSGALSFGLNEKPPAPKRSFNKTITLKTLQETALAVVRDVKNAKQPEAEQVQRLLLLGTAMGGARPKAVVEDRSGLWIAKFNKPDDNWNYAKVEHSMLTLARLAGLNVSESKIVKVANKDVLLVKRFDREKIKGGYLRFRMVSGLTLLGVEEDDRQGWSYPALAESIRRACAEPKKNAEELFRRMVFNSLISNLDDHPKNHAVIAKNREWCLSPAYDLTPSPAVGTDRRDLAMEVGRFGRYANTANLLSECQRFLLNPASAQEIIDSTKQIIESQWYNVARTNNKVSIADCEKIRGAFVYPGFSYELAAA